MSHIYDSEGDWGRLLETFACAAAVQQQIRWPLRHSRVEFCVGERLGDLSRIQQHSPQHPHLTAPISPHNVADWEATIVPGESCAQNEEIIFSLDCIARDFSEGACADGFLTAQGSVCHRRGRCPV